MKKNFADEEVADGAGTSVVVIYETLAARELAADSCEKFVIQAHLSPIPEVHQYSFDDLLSSSSKEKVTQAAADADVLAFAFDSSGDLPRGVKLWTEELLVRQASRGGLLVGLVSAKETEVRGVACLKEIYLRHLAHRAGMDFLTHFPVGVLRTMPDSLDSFTQKANRVTPLLDEILRSRWVTHIPPLK